MSKITPDIQQMQIISSNIKRLLKIKDMTQRELAESLNLSESSVGKWLLCKNAPTMGNVQRMANLFGVQVSDIVNEKTTNTPTANKPTLKVTPQMKSTVQVMSRLNEDGQDEVLHHAELLESSGRYVPSPVVREVQTYTELYSVGGAAAGDGYAYNDLYKDADESYRVILSDEIPKHDLVLDVKGNSMFPTIYDGDVIFVKRAFDRVDRKIYALEIDGEVFVKRVVFGKDYITLVSDNLAWEDRTITGYDLEERTHFIGQVVGWETPMK